MMMSAVIGFTNIARKGLALRQSARTSFGVTGIRTESLPLAVPQRLRPADNEAGRNLGERHAQSFPLVPCHHSAVCARICGACAAISKPPDPLDCPLSGGWRDGCRRPSGG